MNYPLPDETMPHRGYGQKLGLILGVYVSDETMPHRGYGQKCG